MNRIRIIGMMDAKCELTKHSNPKELAVASRQLRQLLSVPRASYGLTDAPYLTRFEIGSGCYHS